LSGQVSVAQAKARFAALVARAEAGETIRNGRPVACLGPLPVTRPIKYGDLSGIFLAEDLSLPADVVGDFEPVV
jgi:antitoxin (DNA-binding transcriptional repressor) of toxin-antitoxin stability system